MDEPTKGPDAAAGRNTPTGISLYGPGASGCSIVIGSGVTANPWLTQPVGDGDDEHHDRD